MKAKLLVTFVLAALLMSTANAAAEEIDSVILTTNAHYPDTIVAGAVGNQIGAPVFVTMEDSVDSDVLAEIESLSPTNIYIVGGTEVITEDVETALADYNVVRIWGLTRYGTAAELAEYFWESSEKAMLVWDVLGLADAGNYEMLSDARDLAIQEDMPVLLIKKNEIPEQVVDALLNLSVESVVLVGNVGSDVTDALEELEIEVSEEIKGADAEETRERVKEKVKEKLREKANKHLVVVAAGDWSDSIKAPYLTNGSARHITSEDQLDDLVAEINDMEYDSVKIVGNPELAQTVYDRLTEEGIEADLVSGRQVAAATVAFMKKELARIRVKANATQERLREMFQRMAEAKQNETDRLVERTRMFITDSGLAGDLKDRLLNWLSEKKDSFDANLEDGNYAEAAGDYTAIKKQISTIALNYKSRLATAYRNLMERETQLTTAISNLRDKVVSIRDRVTDASNI